jgi:hypothetical protein
MQISAPLQPSVQQAHQHAAASCLFARAKSRVPGVTAAVGYLAPMTERPYNYMYEPGPGQAWQNCKYQMSPVWISDARTMASSASIDLEGFELWDAPTSMADFDDEDTIRSRYYAEAAELAKCVTKADRAYVFDHLRRWREAGRPALHFGRKGNEGNRPGAVGRVHTDYSETSGLKRLDLVVLNPEDRSRLRRFAIVNIWRSIRAKIVDTPLALCDARTVSANDLAASDIFYPNRRGEIYLVQQSPHHRWAYFSEMDRHEALIFKQYDSQVNGVARFTPHTAFDLPDIPPNAPLRESVEIRCLVTYD